MDAAWTGRMLCDFSRLAQAHEGRVRRGGAFAA
jgi:hypothetical protein